jgi:hypothetical protein
VKIGIKLNRPRGWWRLAEMRAIRGRKYRSRLEASVAKKAQASRISLEYEPFTVAFVQPAKKRKYNPDFVLANGILIEVKGRLTREDRVKMILVRDQNPQLDIRFVFKEDGWLTKTKTTRYSEWCKNNNFKYAFERIPIQWTRERARGTHK